MKYLNFLFAVLLFFSCSDDKKWELIGSRILDSDDNPILCESFSVSQNAGKFAFTEREEYSSHTYLSTMNLDGTDHQKSSIEASNAAWSHDGSLLYFDYDGDIYSVNPDFTNQQIINTALDDDKFCPRPSPDGQYLAFVLDKDSSYSSTKDHDIYLLRLSDSSLIKTTGSDMYIKDFNWNTTSDQIVLERRDIIIGRSYSHKYIHLISDLFSGNPQITQISDMEVMYPSFLNNGNVIGTVESGLALFPEKGGIPDRLILKLSCISPIIHSEGNSYTLFFMMADDSGDDPYFYKVNIDNDFKVSF